MSDTSRVDSPGRPASRFAIRVFAMGTLVVAAVAPVAGGQAAHAPAAVVNASPSSPAADAAATVAADDERSRLVYSVNRTPERPFDTSRAVQVITAEDVWRRNARTVPELLMYEAGVFVQQTNYGGGSPIIRGLMGKQIVILVDGVRLNNATFRFGPLQYLDTIDISSVERIEIVRGVESVLGSDSLGGLINIILKKGPGAGADQPFGASVSTRFSTADDSGAGHAEAFGRIDRLRYSAGVTYRATGDVTAGGGVGVQREQAYDERAGAFSLQYSLSPARTLSARYHGMEQDKVGGATRSATTAYLVTDPQTLKLLTFEFQDLTKYRFFDQLQVTGYLNRQEEGQLEIRSTAPAVERRNMDTDHVFGASLQMASYLGSHRLIYGTEFTDEQIGSIRHDVNTSSGAIATARGKFTDNSRYRTASVYLQDRFDVTKWVTLSAGGRYGRTSAAGTENSSVAVLDLASAQDGFTGSIGAVGHLSRNVNLVGNVTRGFRPPNIDDLSRYEERKEGVEVPNPDLSPERSVTYDIGVKFDSARADGAVFYYNSELRDLHDRRSGVYDGLAFFDLNGNGVQDAKEPMVLQRVNVGRATIRGLELDGRFRVTSSVSLAGNYTTTDGEDHVLNEPLSRVPPGFGMLAVRWTPRVPRRVWSEFMYHFAAAQRDVSTRDKGDARIGPKGTDGFNVLSLRGGFDLVRQLRLTVGFENITDEAYKYHASGVMRPGRQLVIGTEFGF